MVEMAGTSAVDDEGSFLEESLSPNHSIPPLSLLDGRGLLCRGFGSVLRTGRPGFRFVLDVLARSLAVARGEFTTLSFEHQRDALHDLEQR